MKTESIVCMLGYALAVAIIFGALGKFNNASWMDHILAFAGSVPIGYWCAHCDMREGL